jgi:transcriptional regulator with XRE-family HTH domain
MKEKDKQKLKNFGLYMEKLREKSGYRSQRDLAEKSGVSHSTINRIESGTNKASAETLKALAPYLKGVNYNDLFKEAGYLDDDESKINEHKQKDEKEFYNDPNLGLFFKEIKEAPEDKQEELRRIWDILHKNEASRKPGDKQ